MRIFHVRLQILIVLELLLANVAHHCRIIVLRYVAFDVFANVPGQQINSTFISQPIQFSY